MPLGDFGRTVSSNMTLPELLNEFAKVQKLLDYLLNGGLDTLNVLELSADVINTGILNAGLVKVHANLSGSAFITIDGNGIRINDGTQDTFVADIDGNVTLKGVINALGGQIGGFTIDLTKLSGPGIIEGGIIRTAESGTRVELNSVGNIFAAYKDNNNYIAVDPDATGSPTMILETPNAKAFIAPIDGAGVTSFNSTVGGLSFNAQDGHLDLKAAGGGYKVRVQSWSDLYGINNAESLQQILTDLQDQIDDLDARVTALGG